MKNNYKNIRTRFFLFFAICWLFPFASNAQVGTWTWMKGDSAHLGSPVYGTMGVSDSSTVPYSIYEAARWTDMNGRFWIFGGVNLNGNTGGLLWMYDPNTNNWIWMKGNGNYLPIYGTQGVPDPNNQPSSRGWGAASWTDTLGNLWLYGGEGYDMYGGQSALADLWKYNIATNEWTWMNGPLTSFEPGNYGVQGIPDVNNLPPSRDECIANWIDDNGDLWLYGGFPSSAQYSMNDMWKYSPSTNMWTWMSGSTNTFTVLPNYGTLYVASPGNTPGGRGATGSWKDENGNFWLYGGYDDQGFDHEYGDMWKYDPAINQWAWMAGSTVSFANNSFTLQNIPGNGSPGARMELKSVWTDKCGKFWAYGGQTIASFNWYCLNDMWMFDPTTNQFTWISGLNYPGAPGDYGSYQIPALTNYPDGLGGGSPFTDVNGNFWMFGGTAYPDQWGSSNAMWKYERPFDSCFVNTGIYYEAADQSFLVYPNPGHGTIYVQLSEKTEMQGLVIQLYDATGKLVETKTELQSRMIEIDPEAAGLYFVVLTNSQGKILGSTKVLNTN
ncbi:hypothetical protein BH09BAC5_BH09BAC5_06500 [soil metagenome]